MQHIIHFESAVIAIKAMISILLDRHLKPIHFSKLYQHSTIITMAEDEDTAKSYDTFNLGPSHGEKLWRNNLFGCFDDFRICIFTFCVPCYTIGRNADDFGENGCVIGILYGLGFAFALGPVMRWRLREKKSIHGSMVGDILIHWLCPCCALIQENKEIFGDEGSHLGEKMPVNINIERK